VGSQPAAPEVTAVENHVERTPSPLSEADEVAQEATPPKLANHVGSGKEQVHFMNFQFDQGPML
jgi:hypothetical protein